MREPQQHFYAASTATWMVTTPDRNLPEMLKLMDKEGYAYNLFLVPLDHTASYEIRMYQPQVEGTQWLGFFEPKEK